MVTQLHRDVTCEVSIFKPITKNIKIFNFYYIISVTSMKFTFMATLVCKLFVVTIICNKRDGMFSNFSVLKIGCGVSTIYRKNSKTYVNRPNSQFFFFFFFNYNFFLGKTKLLLSKKKKSPTFGFTVAFFFFLETTVTFF